MSDSTLFMYSERAKMLSRSYQWLISWCFDHAAVHMLHRYPDLLDFGIISHHRCRICKKRGLVECAVFCDLSIQP